MERQPGSYSSDIFFKDAVNTVFSGISLDTANNPTYEGLYFVDGKGSTFRKVEYPPSPVDTKALHIICGGAEVMFKRAEGLKGVELSYIKFGNIVSQQDADQLQKFLDSVPFDDQEEVGAQVSARMESLRPSAFYVPRQGLMFVADGQPQMHVDMDGRSEILECLGDNDLVNSRPAPLQFDMSSGDLKFEMPEIEIFRTSDRLGSPNNLILNAGIEFNPDYFEDIEEIVYNLDDYSEEWYYLIRGIVNPYTRIEKD